MGTARAHVLALTIEMTPDDTRRFIISSDAQFQVSALETHLRRLFPDYRMDASPHPSAALKAFLSVPIVWRLFVSEFQHVITAQTWTLSNAKSKNQLGLKYRALDETLQDTVKSMVDTGFVKA